MSRYQYAKAFIEESGAWQCGPYRVIVPDLEHPGAVGSIVAQGERELCELILAAFKAEAEKVGEK